jgi:deoxycytidine triphosphate deaminase
LFGWAERNMLLRDEEILRLLLGEDGQPPIASNIEIPTPPFGPQSSIQPSSLDLRIGTIFLPEAPEDEEGGMGSETIEHWLDPGHTAVVSTLEELRLPSHIAGFGFPPTRISANAILMTNPGHIDPGYIGYLSFTVINMGKRTFCLKRGDTIVTCLLMKLRYPVSLDYTAQGHGPKGSRPSRKEVDQLSRDFLNFSRRSTEIADAVATERLEEIRRNTHRRDLIAIGVGLVALLLALLPLYFAFLPPILELKEFSGEVRSTSRLKAIEQRLEQIERKLANGGSDQRQ